MLTQGFSRNEKGVQVGVRMSWQGFLVSSEADKEGSLLITDFLCVLGPQSLPLFFLDGSQSTMAQRLENMVVFINPPTTD